MKYREEHAKRHFPSNMKTVITRFTPEIIGSLVSVLGYDTGKNKYTTQEINKYFILNDGAAAQFVSYLKESAIAMLKFTIEAAISAGQVQNYQWRRGMYRSHHARDHDYDDYLEDYYDDEYLEDHYEVGYAANLSHIMTEGLIISIISCCVCMVEICALGLSAIFGKCIANRIKDRANNDQSMV